MTQSRIQLIALLPSLCYGQQYVPYIKGEYGYDVNVDKPVQGVVAEYTYLKDIATRYNARLFGYTVGVMDDKYGWGVTFYYTVKVSEWNELARIGVIMNDWIIDFGDKRAKFDPESIRLHGSYGFDNIFTRKRTDGRLWSIEGLCGMGKTDLKRVPDWESGLCLTNITLGYGTTIIESMVDSDNDIRYIVRFNTPGNAD